MISLAPAFAQSEATITQVGDRNTVSLMQWAAGQALGSRAVISQSGGNLNEVYLTQTGRAEAEIFQTGTDNGLFGVTDLFARSADGATLFLSQTGTGNLAFVDQAAGAYAEIIQNGINNTATIIQH